MPSERVVEDEDDRQESFERAGPLLGLARAWNLPRRKAPLQDRQGRDFQVRVTPIYTS
jgi:hypothetical protein